MHIARADRDGGCGGKSRALQDAEGRIERRKVERGTRAHKALAAVTIGDVGDLSVRQNSRTQPGQEAEQAKRRQTAKSIRNHKGMTAPCPSERSDGNPHAMGDSPILV